MVQFTPSNSGKWYGSGSQLNQSPSADITQQQADSGSFTFKQQQQPQATASLCQSSSAAASPNDHLFQTPTDLVSDPRHVQGLQWPYMCLSGPQQVPMQWPSCSTCAQLLAALLTPTNRQVPQHSSLSSAVNYLTCLEESWQLQQTPKVSPVPCVVLLPGVPHHTQFVPRSSVQCIGTSLRACCFAAASLAGEVVNVHPAKEACFALWLQPAF